MKHLVAHIFAIVSLLASSSAQGNSDCPESIQRINPAECLIESMGFVLSPGDLKLKFYAHVSKEDITRFFEEYGLGRRNVVRRISMAHAPDDYIEFYSVQVPVGHEEHMKRVLRSTGKVEWASREPVIVAAVDSAAIFTRAEALNRLQAPPMQEVIAAASQPFDFMARIIQVLQEFYASRGKVEVLKKHRFNVKVQVRGLRGEVLPTQKHWERHELHITVTPEGENIHLHTILDAYSASGVAAPPDTGFAAMSQNYHADMTRYLDRLTVLIREGLAK